MKTLFNIENGFKALVIVLLSMIAFNANAAKWSGELGYANDYVFRGVSQTQGGSSAFGSIDLDLENGVNAGVWVGQVDFAGNDASEEIYSYISYSKTLSDAVSVSVGYGDYTYAGDSSLNGSEQYVSINVKDFGLTHVMGNDTYNDYTRLSYTGFDIVDIAYGMQDGVGDSLMFAKSFDLPFGGLEGSVAYIDFTADDSSLLPDEDQFVVSVSKAF